MIQTACLTALLTLTLAAKEKPVVVVAAGDSWSAAVEKTLEARYQVKLEDVTSDDEACETHSALSVLSFKAKKGKKPPALVVYSCPDAEQVVSLPLKGKPNPKKGLPKPMAKKLFKKMPKAPPPSKKKAPTEPVVEAAPEISGESPAPEPEEAPAAAPAAEEKPPVVAEEEKPTPAPAPPSKKNHFGVYLFGRALQRQLRYSEADVTQMNAHTMSMGPVAGADLELFPAFLAFSENMRLGVRAQYGQLFGIETRNEDGSVILGTNAQDIRALLAFSMRFGGFFIEPQAGYSILSMGFSAKKGEAPPALSGVDYRAIRAGARLGYFFTETFSLLGEGNYRHLLSAGQVTKDFYPQWKGNAFDASVGFSWRVVSGLDVRLLGEWTQANLTFTPEETALYQARGASDRWLSGSLYLGWQF